MKTLQFEATKVALKQDKSGYVLTLSLHPDDIPEDLLRDFVGSRYQVVMVRMDSNEKPMDRQEEFQGEKAVRTAAFLCREKEFWEYLFKDNQIIEANEKEATDWMRDYLNIASRAELKTNHNARLMLASLQKEYTKWKES